MGRIIYLFVFLICFTCNLYAQEFGFDTLAGAKYPKVVRSIPNQYGIGVFAETFGDAFPLVKNELYRGRVWVRVQFIWSDTHSFGDKDIPTLKRLARKYAPLCNTGRLEISPFCEHNVKNPDKYLDIVAKAMPGCEVVNTPWQGAFSKKYKNEIHGNHSIPQGKYNFSYDGTNAVDSNVEAFKSKHSRASKFLFWHPRFNLKWSMKDSTPRPQRKALPTVEFTNSIIYLTTSKGKTSIPKNWLIKSHAEKHDAADLKGDKLLIISPIKSSKIVLKRDRKQIGTLPYYGTFEGGGYRYYSPTFGYKLGANLDVVINKKKYGNINAGFRDPTFRD